jgi:hypothetical protein
MRIVTIGTGAEFEGCVGEFSCCGGFSDIVMAEHAEFGWATFHQLIVGAFVAGIATVFDRWVKIFRQKFGMSGAVRRVAAGTSQGWHVRSKMRCLEILVF